MTALAASRDTPKQGELVIPNIDNYLLAANTKVYAGGMAALSGGYVKPAAAATGLVIVGRFDKDVDNTGGSAGAQNVDVRRGQFRWYNSSGADLIAQANVGSLCYAVDDQTVALTDGGGARSVAGVIKAVESAGVWVEHSNLRVADVLPRLVLQFPLDLASIAAGQVVGAVTPGFSGRLLKDLVIVNKPATTAAKAATLQPRITGVSVTGGAIALTSANMTPQGNVVAGSAITALNTFGPADTIDVQASSVTAFVEGTATLYLFLG